MKIGDDVMSPYGHTENHEISLPMAADSAFSLIEKAAGSFGKIKDSNRMLGIITFKSGLNFFKMRNPVNFTANIAKQDENNTLVRMVVNSGDGTIGFNSANRAYQEFIKILMSMPK